MANKQSLPDTRLAGAGLLKTASAKETPIAKRVYGGNPTIDLAIKGLGAAYETLKAKKRVDDEQMTLETDRTLQEYRNRLAGAQSEEEFNMIAKAAEDDLNNRFLERFNGKEFWAKHGGKIIEASRADVQKIRQKKNAEFGRQSFNQALADNQNLLFSAVGTKGETLISRGLNEIEQTPFLSQDEKSEYKTGYLQSGILNVALNDAKEARRLLNAYLPHDEALLAKIDETEKLRLNDENTALQKQKREQDILRFNNAFAKWAARENGEISSAAFHVLTAQDDDDVLWGDKVVKSDTPLADAYRIVKKINKGDELSADEITTAGNSFIAAYKQKKLGLEAVMDLHNQLMLAKGDKNVSGMLFDDDVDKLADRVLLPDFDSADMVGFKKNLMEKKAKLAFDIYESYYSKKTALADEFVEQGGVITPMLEKRFRRQALKETSDELGLKENVSGELRFSELRGVLKNVYVGLNEGEVWQQFYEQAPFVEDKKALLKQIGARQQRLELSYPQFNSLAELEAADLLKGEKFYFKGRLATKA